MPLVYFLQIVFLGLAFAYGYRHPLRPLRAVGVAALCQLAYGLLLYIAFQSDSGALTVWDMLKLEKELWLRNWVRWLAARLGRDFRLRADDPLFALLLLTGGFYTTLLAVLAGHITRAARAARKADSAPRQGSLGH